MGNGKHLTNDALSRHFGDVSCILQPPIVASCINFWRFVSDRLRLQAFHKSFVNLSAHLIHLLPVPTFLAAAPLVQRAGQLQ